MDTKNTKKIGLLLSIALAFQSCQKEQSPAPLLWGYALEGFPIGTQEITALKNNADASPGLICFYLQWDAGSSKQTELTQTFKAIWEAGAVPCLTWEPSIRQEGIATAIPVQEILSGKYDKEIVQVASAVKEFGKPVFIRFAHEMNLDTYHWGTTASNYGPFSPDVYKKMFSYVKDKFTKTEASHARWVFCPNADSSPNEAWNTMANYYPGDREIDLLGLDGYSWTEKQTRSFYEIFERSIREIRKINAEKPLIIFETAISGSAMQKKEWIDGALKSARAWGLTGIIWFQVNKEKGWRLTPDVDLSDVREATSPAQRFAESLR